MEAPAESRFRQENNTLELGRLCACLGVISLQSGGCSGTGLQEVGGRIVGNGSRKSRVLQITVGPSSGIMNEMRSLRRLRCRGLGGDDASLFPADEHLHRILIFAGLVGVFVGVL
jgi:hypothetical protein